MIVIILITIMLTSNSIDVQSKKKEERLEKNVGSKYYILSIRFGIISIVRTQGDFLIFQIIYMSFSICLIWINNNNLRQCEKSVQIHQEKTVPTSKSVDTYIVWIKLNYFYHRKYLITLTRFVVIEKCVLQW